MEDDQQDLEEKWMRILRDTGMVNVEVGMYGGC